MTDVVIVSAARTPVGSFHGAAVEPARVQAGRGRHQGGAGARRRGPRRRGRGDPGPGAAGGRGPGPGASGRRSSAGIPVESPAWSLNQLCGSGLRAVALAYQQIARRRRQDRRRRRPGKHEPGAARPAAARRPEDGRPRLRRHHDQGRPVGRLPRLSHGPDGREHRRAAGRSPARTRTRFAVASQNKAEAAQKAGKFADEIAPVTIKGRKGDMVVDQDEYIRHGATLEAMAGLRPAFNKDGSVTAANASGLNDGAAALVLMSADEAKARGLKPLARIASWATAGVDPAIMGTGPIPASRKALEKAGWTVADLDLIESNEAFAAQSLCVVARTGPRPGQGERQRRRHRHRPPDRRLGRAHPDHPAARDEALGRQEGPGHAVRRRRHGRGHVRRALTPRFQG